MQGSYNISASTGCLHSPDNAFSISAPILKNNVWNWETSSYYDRIFFSFTTAQFFKKKIPSWFVHFIYTGFTLMTMPPSGASPYKLSLSICVEGGIGLCAELIFLWKMVTKIHHQAVLIVSFIKCMEITADSMPYHGMGTTMMFTSSVTINNGDVLIAI